MNFLQPLGFVLFGLGMSDTWVYYQRGEIFFKATQSLNGKIYIMDSSDRILISSREEAEIISYLTQSLRNLKIDKLL